MIKDLEIGKEKLRLSLLVITFCGILLTLFKLIFDAHAASRQVSSFAFPVNVLLADGKIIDSQLLTDTVIQEPRKYDAAIAGRLYRYHYDNIPLDIEMRYIIGTLGNVEGLIKNHTTINLPPGKIFKTVLYQEGIGYYGLFTYENKAYLSSCINPQGESTVSTKQFLKNRNIHNISFHRFLPWLLGEESLVDRRCLWAHLSTSINNVDDQIAYKILEKAWLSSYRWWNPRFPKH